MESTRYSPVLLTTPWSLFCFAIWCWTHAPSTLKSYTVFPYSALFHTEAITRPVHSHAVISRRPPQAHPCSFLHNSKGSPSIDLLLFCCHFLTDTSNSIVCIALAVCKQSVVAQSVVCSVFKQAKVKPLHSATTSMRCICAPAFPI